MKGDNNVLSADDDVLPCYINVLWSYAMVLPPYNRVIKGDNMDIAVQRLMKLFLIMQIFCDLTSFFSDVIIKAATSILFQWIHHSTLLKIFPIIINSGFHFFMEYQ